MPTNRFRAEMNEIYSQKKVIIYDYQIVRVYVYDPLASFTPQHLEALTNYVELETDFNSIETFVSRLPLKYERAIII